MPDGRITDEELEELVQRTEEATSAFMRGDMDRYLALTAHARGFTLMNPLGGPPARYDERAESLGRRRAISGAAGRRPAGSELAAARG